MSYAPLHPTQTVTVKRLSAAALPGGMERPAAPTTVATPVCGVEDVTAEVRSQPEGRNVELALRLWTADVASVFREGDLVALTYRGAARTLEVTHIDGPYGTGDWDHQELTCEQAMHRSSS